MKAFENRIAMPSFVGSGSSLNLGRRFISSVVQTLRIGCSEEAKIAHLKNKRCFNRHRKLAKILIRDGDATILVFSSPAEIDEYLDRSVPVQKRTDQNLSTKTTANSEQLRTILRQYASDGTAIFFILETDGDVAAFQKRVRDGGSYALQEHGFDGRFEQRTPERSLRYASFDTLADQGIAILDFGPGGAQYKSALTLGSLTIWSFVWFGLRIRARSASRSFMGLVFSDPFLKALLGSRLTNFVRSSRRKIISRTAGDLRTNFGSITP